MEKKVTSPAVKGLIISLVLIVFSLVIQFTGLEQNKGIGAISIILFIGGLIWTATSYSNQLNNNVTFGNAFSHAFKTAAAVTAIMVVYTIISLKFISPESVDIAMREARTSMEQRNMSDDQIETGIEFTKKNFFPLAIGGVLLVYLLGGLIGALIGAAIAKKSPNGPFAEQV